MPDAFVKTAPAGDLGMFEAEAAGLEELRRAGEIRVPAVLEVGVRDGQSYIALERLRLERPSSGVTRRLGKQLARLHAHTAERHGWFRDNTIGPTPQPNAESDDWVGFYRERRLAFQLELAAQNGYRGELSEAGALVLERLPRLFESYRPAPSLLHGDLWGGNWGAAGGVPVIFDPAVYFGDRETDLAMTRLFGGFGREFYAAYESAWPLASGHEPRAAVYQLYHVLNHLNLFGSGYLGQALALMRRLLAGELA